MPYIIPKTSSALKLLQHARYEAHCIAVNYHRDKRIKRKLKTELTKIDGIRYKNGGRPHPDTWIRETS